MNLSVAIMQPTYLPWLGYFALMSRVKYFVFLDDVQFSKRSWQQRNQIKTINGPQWLTVPVITKGRRDQLIKDVLIDSGADYVSSHLKSIKQNYIKTKYFDDYYPLIESVFKKQEYISLLELNLNFINLFREVLGINTQVFYSSNINASGLKASYLLDICKEIQANEYISPPGSSEYLDLAAQDFIAAGVKVSYFQYGHPIYSQMYPPFYQYMSILDLIFNEGEASLEILQSGILEN